MHGQQNDKYTEMHGQQNIKEKVLQVFVAAMSDVSENLRFTTEVPDDVTDERRNALKY